jgi:hypothetical protein
MSKNQITRRSFLETTVGTTGAMIAAKQMVLRVESIPLALSVPGQSQSRVEGSRVRSDRLKRYAFDYQSYSVRKLGEPGLLIGNSELGGMADAQGLGVPTIWGAAIWSRREARAPMGGLTLACDQFGSDRVPTLYRQWLSLEDAVLRTTFRYQDGSGFETQQFFSMSTPGLFVLGLKNMGGLAQRKWRVVLPNLQRVVVPSLEPENHWINAMLGEMWLVSPPGGDNNVLTGVSPASFTQMAWAVRANKTLRVTTAGTYELALAPEESVTVVLSVVAGGNDVIPGPSGDECLELARQQVMAGPLDFDQLAGSNRDAWEKLWASTAVLAIPEEKYERIWYRSLFQTIMTAGSKRYLPGESMFAVPCWDMRPFTYGAAGWAALAFIAAGLPQRAVPILDRLYRPQALAANAAYFMRRLNIENGSKEALSFAHEQMLDGRNNPSGHYEMERAIDGFAAAMFYRFGRYYPDEKYFQSTIYPVLRGTSEFWVSVAGKDGNGGYILPAMTSLSEDLIQPNLFDIVIAAKYCLMLAYRYAVEMNTDGKVRERWKEVGDGLAIPQNTEKYLEFLGDKEDRPGAGYQGIRGFAYAGYPMVEMASSLDRAKIENTLDYTWKRNREGEGMIGFVAGWFALCETTFGRGDHALTLLTYLSKCLDKWNYSLSEVPGNQNYYFIDNYASFVLVPISMALESCDDRITPFAAIPAEWKDFAFYDVPAEAGIRVSGELKDGKVQWVSYSKDGRELLRIGDGHPVMIKRDMTGRTFLQST